MPQFYRHGPAPDNADQQSRTVMLRVMEAMIATRVTIVCLRKQMSVLSTVASILS